MKLLKIIKDDFKEELKGQINQTEHKLIESEKKLQAFKEEASIIRTEIKSDIAKEVDSLKKKKGKLLDKVLRLEERKFEAMKPIAGFKELLKKREKELKLREKDIDRVVKSNDKFEEELCDRENKITRDEEIVCSEKNHLSSRKSDLIEARRMFKKHREKLLVDKEKWNKEKIKEEVDIKKRLDKAKSKEWLVKQEKKVNKDNKEAIEQDRLKLYSQQETLKLAFKEYKQLNK